MAQQDTSETTVLIRGSPVVVSTKRNTAQFKNLDFFDGHELFTSHFDEAVFLCIEYGEEGEAAVNKF